MTTHASPVAASHALSARQGRGAPFWLGFCALCSLALGVLAGWRSGNWQGVALGALTALPFAGAACTLCFLQRKAGVRAASVEAHLSELLLRLAALQDGAPLGILRVDSEGRIVEANPAFMRMVGGEPVEVLGEPLQTFLPEGRAVLAGGRIEHVVVRTSGARLTVQISGVPLEAASSRGAWLMVNDISEQAAAMHALEESEMRWQFALEGAGDGLWDWDVVTRRAYLSPRWLSMFGYSPGDLSENMDEWPRLLHPDDEAAARAAARAHLDGSAPVYVSEHRILCKDGSYRWILERGKVVARDGAGRATRVIGSCTDISHRKEIETELERQHELLRAISRLQARYIGAARAESVFANMLDFLLGYSGSEAGFIGEPVTSELGAALRLHAVAERDRRSGAISHIADVPPRVAIGEEDDLVSASVVSRSAVILSDPNDIAAGTLLAGTDIPLKAYLGVPIIEGNEVVGVIGLANRPEGYDACLLGELEPLLASYGKMLMAQRNETLRAEAEQGLIQNRDMLAERVREQTAGLLRAKNLAEQANEAKSLFLANMSHELRTPMHAILSFARLGSERMYTANPDKLRDYFERIHTAGQRLLDLLNNLLDLSKLEAGKMEIEPVPLQLGGVVEAALRELDPLLAARTLHPEVVHAGDDGLHGDPLRIGQVVRNLLSNAVKFSPQGGRIDLRISRIMMPAGRRAGDTGEVAAVELAVADQGPGIPEDELEHIFDKFVQSSKTRSGAGGTGLGLAICREIVLAHRGQIFARNRAGGGAEVIVQLPVAAIRSGAARREGGQ